jgi:hypothetical protein
MLAVYIYLYIRISFLSPYNPILGPLRPSRKEPNNLSARSGSSVMHHLLDMLGLFNIPEAKFLDEIQTKEFPPCYFSFALRFLFLQNHATSYSFYSALVYIVKEKGRKTWWKTTPPSLWFKKSIQKPQVWELSRLCPETWKKLHVREFGFRLCAKQIFREASVKLCRKAMGEIWVCNFPGVAGKVGKLPPTTQNSCQARRKRPWT